MNKLLLVAAILVVLALASTDARPSSYGERRGQHGDGYSKHRECGHGEHGHHEQGHREQGHHEHGHGKQGDQIEDGASTRDGSGVIEPRIL